MTAPFRFTDQKPQFTVSLGTLAANGRVLFYETGTSTPKNVYSDPTLGTSLGSTITLNAAGRTTQDIWMEGEYRVDVQDVDDVSIPGWPLDYVRNPATAGGLVPPDPTDGSDGQVLATDGTANGWFFVDLPAMPSQAGNEGKYVTTDGESFVFATFPSYDADNLPGGITASSTSVVIGTAMIQCGSGTAATNGSIRVTASVSFSPAFTATPKVVMTANVGGVTGDTPPASVSAQATGVSNAGCTAEFFAGAEANSDNKDITTPVTFSWIAMGEYDP